MKNIKTRFLNSNYIGILTAIFLCLSLYIFTMAPALVPGDSAEFQFLAMSKGIAHSSGYPIYLTLLNLLDQILPIYNAAWKANFFSILCASLVLLFWGKLYLEISGVNDTLPKNTGGFFLGVIIFLSPLFWVFSLITEVYTLQLTLFAVIAYHLVKWQKHQQGFHLFNLVFWVTLGLMFHLMTLMIIPATVLLLLFDYKVVFRRANILKMLLAVSCAVFINIVLFYLLWQEHNSLDHLHASILANYDLWDFSSSGFWDEFIFVFTGGQFHNRMLSFSWLEFQLLPYRIMYLVGYFGILLSSIGVIKLYRLSFKWFLFSVTFAVTVITINISYEFPGIIVYYLPLLLPLSLWSVIGLEGLLTFILKRFNNSSRHFKAGCWKNLGLSILVSIIYFSGLYYAQYPDKISRFPEIQQSIRDFGKIPNFANMTHNEAARKLHAFNTSMLMLLEQEVDSEAIFFADWTYVYMVNYLAIEQFKNKDIKAFELKPLSPKETFSRFLPDRIEKLRKHYEIYFIINSDISEPLSFENFVLKEIKPAYLTENTRLYRLLQ